jgi:hypothetical protein
MIGAAGLIGTCCYHCSRGWGHTVWCQRRTTGDPTASAQGFLPIPRKEKKKMLLHDLVNLAHGDLETEIVFVVNGEAVEFDGPTSEWRRINDDLPALTVYADFPDVPLSIDTTPADPGPAWQWPDTGDSNSATSKQKPGYPRSKPEYECDL